MYIIVRLRRERKQSDTMGREIISNKKVTFLGAFFHPLIGGSATVMTELLHCYDYSCFNVITLLSSGISSDLNFEKRVLRIGPRKIRPYYLDLWVRFLMMPLYVKKACRFAKANGTTKIVCVYPTIDFLLLAYLMRKRMQIPLIVYLHDTIVESMSHSTFSRIAKLLQKKIFGLSSRIMVMSEGMKAFYQQKYGVSTEVIPHIYPDCVNKEVIPRTSFTRRLFWSGAVYGINVEALKRVAKAAQILGVEFSFTTGDETTIRKSLSLPEEDRTVSARFFESRKEYLSALKCGGVLILALSYPDEAKFDEGELSTIFPTKTPDYLASGSPILVHCPENYFLARFFREHKCGVVISEKDPMTLAKGISKLLQSEVEASEMIANAKRAVEYFSAEYIAAKFSKIVDEA